MSDRKLLKCPENQIKYIEKRLKVLKHDAFFDWHFGNITGEEWRYPNYNGNSCDYLSEMFYLHQTKTNYFSQIYDLFSSLKVECQNREFYELAHNLNLICSDFQKLMTYEERMDAEINAVSY